MKYERTDQVIPGGDALVSNAILSETEEKAQNTEILCMQKRTFFGKHQLQPQHLEEVQEDKPHDQIPGQDPTTREKIKVTSKA